jgi:predicted nucleotidyltransferase
MTADDHVFAEFVRTARDDDNALGLVVSGSRGKGAYISDRSDWDVYVVVHERPPGWRHERGERIEPVFVTLEGLRDQPEWNRYAFAHVEPVLDKTGEIASIVAELGRRDPATAGGWLDAYTNSYYRSLRNDRLGLALASRLDASESVPWWLEFLFTAHGRVRPYNKWLRWELETHPLGEPWSTETILPLLGGIVANGAVDEQRALFRLTEPFARERGFGDVIDGWEPDVEFLRG